MPQSDAAATARESRSQLAAKVPLGEDELEFGHAGNTQRWPCKVSLNTEPRLQLVFEVATQVPTISLDPTVSVRLLKAGCSCEVFVTSAPRGDETQITLTPAQEPLTVGGSSQLTEVLFDLVNFPEFFGLTAQGSETVRNRLEIIMAHWRLQLEPATTREETSAFRSPLYQVTHAARLTRTDGAVFDSNEASDVLDLFHAASSFAAGRRTTPVLVRGIEANGQSTWREWGTRSVDPNLATIDTWFDRYHGQALADFIPGAYRLWKDTAWKDTIRCAIDWYVRAAGLAAAPGSGLILLQAALQLLSWQTVVQHRRSLSAEGFQGLSAADQIRLLMEPCQIPTGLPPGLKRLKLAAEEQKRNGLDGPEAIARMRSRLVHPSPAEELPVADGFQLAAWYVELALLKLFGFNGKYSNRTRGYQRAGSLEPVPWSH